MPKVIPHKHCIVCGKAVEPDQVYCSDTCEKKMKDNQRRQRMFFLILFALLFLMMFLSFLTPKG